MGTRHSESCKVFLCPPGIEVERESGRIAQIRWEELEACLATLAIVEEQRNRPWSAETLQSARAAAIEIKNHLARTCPVMER